MRRLRFFIPTLLFIWQFALPKTLSSIEYLFPVPGSHHLPKETVIIIRFKEVSPSRIDNINSFIKVNGAGKRQVDGRTIVSTDGRTIIFRPASPFRPGEKVAVQLHPLIRGNEQESLNTTFHFSVSLQENNTPAGKAQAPRIQTREAPESRMMRKQNDGDPSVLNGVSVPFDFPFVNILYNDQPDNGLIFLNTSWFSDPHYSMILDNTGNPIWYVRTPDNRQDFKVQPDHRITMMRDRGFFDRDFIALDATYTVVDTFVCPPGYFVDEHELQVLTNGHYLLIAKNDSVIDMRQFVSGGSPNANVRGNSVVEMDASDNPVFIWRSWENYDILDAVHENMLGGEIDYVHMNAIAIDLDGHILVSSRHLSEVTKINRQTGKIIWRLGGEHDDFTWVNDEDRISYQHDIRVLPNGHYTVFDNGNYHNPLYSRALELSVNTVNWTVTKVWEYPEAHNIYTGWMGNAQRLPNGNTLICWADNSLPKLTEVRPDGSKAYELDFVESHASYRTFRFPWQAKAAVPYLIIEPGDNQITLLFNQFGDPDVAHYNIYGGTEPNPNQIISTSTKPFIHLTNLINRTNCFFRVTAVNHQGKESGFSNEESVFVFFIEPGMNMVNNGDFSDGFNHWQWYTHEEAQASWGINAKQELFFSIQQGGSEMWHIQALYPNIQLIQGKTYRLEFDAYATQNRLIQVEVTKDGSPWTNYSQQGVIAIKRKKASYSYEFVMQNASESKARLEFDVGSSDINVTIDNVSFKEVITNDVNDTKTTLHHYALFNNYPNPFNPSTNISYTIAESDFVTLTIYDLLGREIEILVNHQLHESGGYTVSFNAKNLTSGVYFYKLQVGDFSNNSGRGFMQIKKMILMH